MDCDPGDAQAHTQALIEQLPRLLLPSEGQPGAVFLAPPDGGRVRGRTPDLRERILMQGDYSKRKPAAPPETIDAGRAA